MAVTELKDEEWKKFSQADYAVIDCFGDNCAACVMLAPVFDALANELTGIAFGRVNISVYPEIADLHGVNAMPTLLFFRKGELVHQAIGSMEREELLGHVAKLLYE
jgi:thioredoxin 1